MYVTFIRGNIPHRANDMKLHEFYRNPNLISPKLSQYCANEVDNWNQRLELHRNTLFLVDKAGGGDETVQIYLIAIFVVCILFNLVRVLKYFRHNFI